MRYEEKVGMFRSLKIERWLTEFYVIACRRSGIFRSAIRNVIGSCGST